MQSNSCHIRSIFATSLGLLMAGCETGSLGPTPTPAPQPPPTRLVAGTTGFYNFEREGDRAGIDYACIHCAKWDGGEIAYVIWSDLARSGGFTGGPVQGALFSRDLDKRIEYTVAEKHPDNDATVTIDGQAFPLADGAMFLVSTAGEKTVVRQLDIDLSTIGSGEIRDEFKELAQSNTEMQDFFGNPSRDE